MIYKLLKEYISLLEASDENAEEKLKQRAQKSNLNFEESMLLQHDITPIVRDETSWIASGQYTAVYDVSYQGKHAVAKITDSEKDVNAIQKLSDMRSNFEAKLSRHLPVVYEIIHDETGMYIIIVERLVPLEPHIRNLLFSQEKRMMSQVIPILKDRDYISNIIKSSLKKYALVLKPQTISKVIDIVADNIIKTNFKINNVDKELKTLFDMLLHTVFDIVQQDKTPKAIQLVNGMVLAIKKNILKLTEEQHIFPIGVDKSEELELSRKFPGAESLIELLEKLKKIGINWYDLHGENLMQRPKTGDIVISDPGLFEFKVGK
jgi:hypothetical protein